MKLINVYRDDQQVLGLFTEAGIIDVAATAAQHGLDLPTAMMQAIEQGEAAQQALQKLLALAAPQYIPADAVSYAPVVPKPEKIICVGLNYQDHRREVTTEAPAQPILFSKFNNALAAHREEIPLPPIARKYDYEAELVVVIGRQTRQVSAAEALHCVFGYTIGNDLTARELQPLNGQWLLSKTFDKFAPIGPYLVTADEVGDPQQLAIELALNGETRQRAHTSEMIFSCADIISYASQHFTLQPGDLIFTGTPGGVIMGHARGQRRWLQAGDEISIAIEKLGTLQNRLV